MPPRRLRCLLSATVLLAALLGAAGASAQDCSCPERLATANVGHRGTGSSGQGSPFPENTIPSFLQAEAEGATMIELDVQHSADGVLVSMHDGTVDDTTNGSGCVQELTAAELATLDAGAGTAMEGQGVVVPTLAAVLEAVSVDVDIEIKVNDEEECPSPDRAALAADVVAAIEADSKDRRLVVTSFDADVLEQVRAASADVWIGRLGSTAGGAPHAAASSFQGSVVNGDNLDAAAIESIRGLGLQVGVYTVNEPSELETFLDLGVDLLITDEPQLLEVLLAERCADFVPAPECSPAPEPESSCSGCGSSQAAPPRGQPGLLLLVVLLALLRRVRQPQAQRGPRVSPRPASW